MTLCCCNAAVPAPWAACGGHVPGVGDVGLLPAEAAPAAAEGLAGQPAVGQEPPGSRSIVSILGL